jgi:hypothetical protein
MLNLKKTAIAVLALGSSAVFAGTMGPVCTPGSVTVPCERTAWDFGVQALYLQDSVSNEGGFSDSSNNGWGWGFKLEGSYHFSTGNDINVNWYHLNKNHNEFISSITVDGITATDVSLHQKPEWDAVNFEFGQMVNFGEHKIIRFHGGAQYAHAERKVGAFGFVDGISTFGFAEAKYNGFGPRTGLDMSYHFGNGLAIYANSAAALLVGDTSISLLGIAPSSVTAITAKRNNTIVPEVEAKLGATYTYSMAQGDLSLDAGYMVVNYFTAPTVSTRNFGVSGPYVGAKWVGSVA